MAYVEGYPGCRIKTLTLRHAAFLFLVFVTVIGIILYFSEGWLEDVRTMAAILAVMAVFIIEAPSRPTRWRGNRCSSAGVREAASLDRIVADELAALDDDHFVIHDFRFELFHVEHLVISPRGIFVVHKIPRGEPLTVKNGMLYAGDLCLEKNTANLWRICHLIHIVFRKGYKEDCMPEPILVLPEAGPVKLHAFEGFPLWASRDCGRGSRAVRGGARPGSGPEFRGFHQEQVRLRRDGSRSRGARRAEEPGTLPRQKR
jgi:hypothetical protein